jgi:hypothetical protein
MNRLQLPLTLLLTVMQDMQGTHLLRASLPPLRHISKEACFAELRLHNGQVLSCQIKTLHGVLPLQIQEAMQLLYGLQTLEWDVISFSPQQSQDTAHEQHPEKQPLVVRSPGALDIPMRLTQGSLPEQISSFQTRRVFNLIDGVRNIQHIAVLSGVPIEIVQNVLKVLAEAHLITYKEMNR